MLLFAISISNVRLVLIRREEVRVGCGFLSTLRMSPIVTTMGSSRKMSTYLGDRDRIMFVLCKSVYAVPRVISGMGTTKGLTMMRLSLVRKLTSGGVTTSFVGGCARTSNMVSAGPAVVRQTGRLKVLAVLHMFLVSSVTCRGIGARMATTGPSIMRILPKVVPGIVKGVYGSLPMPIVTKKVVQRGRSMVTLLGTKMADMSSAGPRV